MQWFQCKVFRVVQDAHHPTVEVDWDPTPDVTGYEDGGVEEQVLLPSKWNKDNKVGSWRMDINVEEESSDDDDHDDNDNEEEEDVSEADEELIMKCIEVVRQEQKASTSLLQRRLRLGYTRAARMVDILEQRGIVGPGEGAKAREVYLK